MKRIYITFLLFSLSYCLFNMTAFSNMPNKTYSSGLGFSAMQNNANEIYLSVKTSSSSASIVRWNVTSSLNVTQMGSYKQTLSQSNMYYYTYFLNGYILGCLGLDNTPCRVFNQSSYAYLGTLSINLSFGRGQYLSSKNVFVFGATTGQFGYFAVANLPNVTPVYLSNLTSPDFAFLQKSFDQTFISVSYRSNAILNIWRTSDWSLQKNITVGGAGVYTQSWSYNNQYLMVFIFNQSYVEVYDQYSNWTLYKNVTIGYKNIRTNFYYNQTNIVVAFSENSTSVIYINWYDYTVGSVYTVNGWKMYRSDNGKALTIFQPNNYVNTAWFFNINPYCQGNTVYNIPQKKCVGKCEVGCSLCVLSSCMLCSSGYVLENGACQSCGPAQVYNSQTLSCDNCESQCLECTSSTICTRCKSGYNLVDSSCIICPSYSVYNSTSLSCEANCTANCQTCASSSTCSVCKSNYIVLSNGSCQSCPSKTYYNSSSSSCVSCSTNCDQCTSSTVCTTCSTGYYLVNSACISCPAGQFYNSTASKCQANCINNCAYCSNTTNCTVCNSGYELKNNTCVACSSGTFYNSNTSKCESCSQHCTSCTSSTNCGVCSSGYELINNTCVACSSGTFYNSNTSKCESCSQHCTSCTSSTNCTACSNGYNLNSTQCVSCPVGNVFNQTTKLCDVNCTQNCKVCNGTNTCGQCMLTYDLFLNGSCLQCPNGYTFDVSVKDCVQDVVSNNTNNGTDNSTNTNPTNNTVIDNSTNTTPNNTTPDNTTPNNNTTGNNTNTDNSTIIDPDDNNIVIPDNEDSDGLTDQQRLARSKHNTLYEWTMGMTVENDFVAILNKFPGSRRIIRQIFAFFLNIDHLWLYIYHKRQYGYYVNRLLQAVHNLEEEKWNLVSDKFFNQTLKIDMNHYTEQLNYKINQTSYKYIQIENQSSSFFQNNLDYFFLNVPLVLVVFFLFKFLFHLLFRYQISLLFREYAFYGYLLLMLVEGNCESFSYLFIYDAMELNGSNFKQKFLNFMTVLLFMLFIVQLVAGFFVIKSFYDKHAKYFYDNCSNTLTGSVCLLIEYGFLNFCLGAAHIVLENHYNTQLLVLFLVELSFSTVIVYTIRNFNVYEYKYIQWMNILASFLRILLIFTYYFDQKDPGLYQVVDQVQMYLIIIYLFNWIFSALIAYALLLHSFFKYVHKKIFKTNKEKQTTQKGLQTQTYLSKYKNLNNKIPKTNKFIIQTINHPQINQILKKKNAKFNLNIVDKNQKQDDFNDDESPVTKFKQCRFKNKSHFDILSSETTKNFISDEKTLKDDQQKSQDDIFNSRSLGGKSNKKLILNYKKSLQDENSQNGVQWRDTRLKIKTQKSFTRSQMIQQQQLEENIQKSSIVQNQAGHQRHQTHKRSITEQKKQDQAEKSLTMTQLSGGRKKLLRSIRLKTDRNKLKNLNSLQVSMNGEIY